MTAAPVIAVVDDDGSMRVSVARLLRSAGYAVRLYDSAEAFLEDRTLPTPAAVLTDIHMPGMSGLELQTVLRTRDPGFAVLLMTAYPDNGDRDRALAAGARCVLTKPFDGDELINLLEAETGGS